MYFSTSTTNIKTDLKKQTITHIKFFKIKIIRLKTNVLKKIKMYSLHKGEDTDRTKIPDPA